MKLSLTLLTEKKMKFKGELLESVTDLKVERGTSMNFDCLSLNLMKGLTHLNVNGINLGKGAKNIGKLDKLKSLYLRSDSIICDNDVIFLSNLKQLTILDVYFNNIGDEGAKYISEMTQLRCVDIGSNKIGDEGIKHLTKLKQLTNLNIRKNRITERV